MMKGFYLRCVDFGCCESRYVLLHIKYRTYKKELDVIAC